MKICSQKLFLLLVLIFTQLICLTLSQPDIKYYNCSRQLGKFTDNTTYQTNLNTLLSSIPSEIDAYGFGNHSFGQNPDTAYGLALCRGDLKAGDCLTCIRDVTLNLTNSCKNYKEAVGWNGYCTLKYSSDPLIHKLSYEPYHCLHNSQNATDQDEFSNDLRSLLTDLRAKAAVGVRRKFATGNITGSDPVTILGLVQCTPDLSEKECTDCLVLLMGQISSCSKGKVGGIGFFPSCTVRYETYPFFGDTAGPADEKLLVKPLAPPPTSTIGKGTGMSISLL